MTIKNNTYRNVTITSMITVIMITSGIGLAYADGVFQGTNIFGITTGSNANVASGGQSAAFGWGNTASGFNSVAFNDVNIASGYNSAVFGKWNTASGGDSVAFGALNTASGEESSAFGHGTTAQPYTSFVLGTCNEGILGSATTWLATDPLFVIGNGEAKSVPPHDCTTNNNAVTVLKNGNVGIGETNPQQLLVVAGTIESTSGGFTFPDGTTQTTASTGSGSSLWTQFADNVYYSTGKVGIGTSTPTNILSIQDESRPTLSITDTTNDVTLELTTGDRSANIGSPTNNDLNIKTNDITRIKVEKNGNVGIGTNNPNSQLEITGYIELATTSSKPPATDCDASNENGRIIVDKDKGFLYVCTTNGWKIR